MRKTKTKKKTFAHMRDENIAEMFNQMLGTGNVNLDIAYPRYIKIKNICERLIEIFTLMGGSSFIQKHPDLSAERDQIMEFCTTSTKSLNEIFSMNLDDYMWNMSLVDEALAKRFSEVYANMKKANIIKTFIIMCDRLVLYKNYFSDVDKLNYKFVTNMAGVTWCPFPFTALNIKSIFSMPDIGEHTITFFMTIFHKSYKFSKDLYEEIQSPDANVDDFVDYIMRNIDELQKQPQLHRCKEAFQKIKDSVKMLKTNFSGYYRDFIMTKDSTIIMQHFIIDVSKETVANAKVTKQFSTIIQFYKKIAENNNTLNAQLKSLFDKASESFKELENNAENLVNVRDNSPTDEDGSDDSDSELISVAPLSFEDVHRAVAPN
jgi:hypothetical protein